MLSYQFFQVHGQFQFLEVQCLLVGLENVIRQFNIEQLVVGKVGLCLSEVQQEFLCWFFPQNCVFYFKLVIVHFQLFQAG